MASKKPRTISRQNAIRRQPAIGDFDSKSRNYPRDKRRKSNEQRDTSDNRLYFFENDDDGYDDDAAYTNRSFDSDGVRRSSIQRDIQRQYGAYLKKQPRVPSLDLSDKEKEYSTRASERRKKLLPEQGADDVFLKLPTPREHVVKTHDSFRRNSAADTLLSSPRKSERTMTPSILHDINNVYATYLNNNDASTTAVSFSSPRRKAEDERTNMTSFTGLSTNRKSSDVSQSILEDINKNYGHYLNGGHSLNSGHQRLEQAAPTFDDHRSDYDHGSVKRKKKRRRIKQAKTTANELTQKYTHYLKDFTKKVARSKKRKTSEELYFLNVEELNAMVEDMEMIYRRFIHMLWEKQTEISNNPDSSVIEDMRSLYPEYMKGEHKVENGDNEELEDGGDNENKEEGVDALPPQTSTTIMEDMYDLYSDYIDGWAAEAKAQEEREDWDCLIFHYDSIEDGPLGKIVSISKDSENGYYQALAVPFDDDSDLESEKKNIDGVEGNPENPSAQHNHGEETKKDTHHEKRTFKPRFIRKLENRTWYKNIMTFVKFILFFGGVMSILVLAALCFAEIEDPLVPVQQEHEHNETVWRNKIHDRYTIESAMGGNYPVFLIYLQQRYNISIDHDDEAEFLSDLRQFSDTYEDLLEQIQYETLIQDRDFILKKWIYFMVIATTTIGFGDVVPKTDNGKMFYIAFSIIGIPLMMLLLKAAGEILTLIHKNFFKFVNKHLCERHGRKVVSEEFLSALALFVLFFVYLLCGCVFLLSLGELNLLDSIYFWINSFTTVGFGDIIPALETEVRYITILVPYQIFGLTLLAGVIDAWLSYLNYRKDELVRKNRRKMMLRLQKVKRVPKFVSAVEKNENEVI